MILYQLKPKEGFTYALLAPTTVNGKLAYVIEAKGEVKEKILGVPRWITVNGERMEQMFLDKNVIDTIDDLFYIDQANFHLLKREARDNRLYRTFTFAQTINSEVLNAPIPDKTFVFIIPQGMKDLAK